MGIRGLSLKGNPELQHSALTSFKLQNTPWSFTLLNFLHSPSTSKSFFDYGSHIEHFIPRFKHCPIFGTTTPPLSWFAITLLGTLQARPTKPCSTPSSHHLKPISIFWKSKHHCFLPHPSPYSTHQKDGDASSVLHRVRMFNYLWYLKYFLALKQKKLQELRWLLLLSIMLPRRQQGLLVRSYPTLLTGSQGSVLKPACPRSLGQ